MSNIKPGVTPEKTWIEEYGRGRFAFAMTLAIVFFPVIAVGIAFAMTRVMFAIGVSLTEELFED